MQFAAIRAARRSSRALIVALRSAQLQADRLIPALAGRRYEPARPDGRPAGRHTAIANAILPREAERARRAVIEHPEGTAALPRGFLT
jgi:hypothetical protein